LSHHAVTQAFAGEIVVRALPWNSRAKQSMNISLMLAVVTAFAIAMTV